MLGKLIREIFVIAVIVVLCSLIGVVFFDADPQDALMKSFVGVGYGLAIAGAFLLIGAPVSALVVLGVGYAVERASRKGWRAYVADDVD